jgi:hypothetical protein
MPNYLFLVWCLSEISTRNSDLILLFSKVGYQGIKIKDIDLTIFIDVTPDITGWEISRKQIEIKDIYSAITV